MKHPLPSLDALKVFEAAARHLSFTLAAEELCITKGAVSYQVRKLEQSLDCALFRRSVRQVYLTPPGQQLMQTTQRLFAELNSTLSQIVPGDASHDVLIGATTYVASRWLSPRIAGFGEHHPDVSILLHHAVNSDDFRLQDVDFAVRWGAMAGANSRSRPLEMPMPLFPACSPRLLERIGLAPDGVVRDCVMRDGVVRDCDGLEAAALGRPPLNAIPLLCEDRALDLWLAWYGDQPAPLDNPRRVIADANVRTQAAVDGQGWTLADAMMQRELDSGQLVAPFATVLEGYGYAIQSAPGRFVNQSANALQDWLIENA